MIIEGFIIEEDEPEFGFCDPFGREVIVDMDKLTGERVWRLR